MEYKKIDNESFKSIETKTIEQVYELKCLLSEKKMMEGEIKNNQIRLTEINNILKEGEKLGIKIEWQTNI